MVHSRSKSPEPNLLIRPDSAKNLLNHTFYFSNPPTEAEVS